MEELEISGKRYISTRRAAREHGYHSDYMGQLIRGKKVTGEKVGRSWYIEEGSLLAYFGKAAEAKAVAKAPAPAVAAPVAEEVVAEAVVAAPTPAPIPEPVVVAPIPVVAAAPVPAPVIAQPQPIVIEKVAPVIAQEILQPAEIETEEDAVAIEVRDAQETRIPIHTPIQQKPAQSYIHNELGGLRYAQDNSPSLPVITRMPMPPQYQPPAEFMQMPQPAAMRYAAPAPAATASTFPYISLLIVGVLALGAATFASNFVSATVVAEPGKTASVQYAIHW